MMKDSWEYEIVHYEMRKGVIDYFDCENYLRKQYKKVE